MRFDSAAAVLVSVSLLFGCGGKGGDTGSGGGPADAREGGGRTHKVILFGGALRGVRLTGPRAHRLTPNPGLPRSPQCATSPGSFTDSNSARLYAP